MPQRRRRIIRKRPRKYSRRRMPRSNVRADSTYSEKLTYQVQLYVQANVATYSLHWLRSGAVDNTQQFPVGSNTGNQQFRQCAQMFRSYKISGVRLEYKPHFFNLGVNNIIMKSLTVGTKMDVEGAQAMPVPLADFRSSLDTKQYDPMKPFKRYYHISRWAKGRNITWRTTLAASGDFYDATTPDCITNLAVDTEGFNNGAQIGSLRVTYYVKFKDRTAD